MWLKYSHQPILTGEQWDQNQRDDGLHQYQKPRGFWITDDSEHCWRDWCVSEGFNVDNLTHKHEVILDEKDIKFLRTPRALDLFTKRYATIRRWGGPSDDRYADLCIDWPRVAKEHSGLIITPYQWSRRMKLDWYYGWDCASGCIWKASAIKEVRLLEIDYSVLKEEKAA